MKSPGKLYISIMLILSVITLCVALTACGNNTMTLIHDVVDDINSNDSLHSALNGLYTVHAEAQGVSTIIVTFQAELEDLESPDVAEAISNDIDSEFQNAVSEMKSAGIPEPAIVFEFLDMDGELLYTRKFN